MVGNDGKNSLNLGSRETRNEGGGKREREWKKGGRGGKREKEKGKKGKDTAVIDSRGDLLGNFRLLRNGKVWKGGRLKRGNGKI